MPRTAASSEIIAHLAARVPEAVWAAAPAETPETTVGNVLNCLLRDAEFRGHIEVLTDESLAGCCCDAVAAEGHKRAAAKAFAAGFHEEAATLFAHALLVTDETTSAGSAYAARLYANRAQCCLKLNLPANAEADASNAIAADPTYVKGYFRRSRARHLQGKLSQAASDIHTALQHAAKGTDESDELLALLREIEASKEDTAGTDDKQDSGTESCVGGEVGVRADRREDASAATFDSLWQHRTSSESGCSGATRVDCSEGAGRFVVATRDIEAGEVLVRDLPVAAVLRKAHRRTRCWRCLAPLPHLTALPPRASADPLYFCSARCRCEDETENVSEQRRPWRSVLPEEVVLAVRCALMTQGRGRGKWGGGLLQV